MRAMRLKRKKIDLRKARIKRVGGGWHTRYGGLTHGKYATKRLARMGLAAMKDWLRGLRESTARE